MAIAVGDKLPAGTFKIPGEDGPSDITTSEVFDGKKVVLFAVPGAFTGTCTNSHVPGYLDNYDAILRRGVDTIAVLSVNDVHVMRAWSEFTDATGKLVFLADGNGDYTKALGMELDLSAGGLGVRSKRYSMIVEDGVVTSLNIEESPGQAVASGAARMLELL